MEEEESVCWFDRLSDDVLLHVLLFVPRRYWYHIRNVCTRFRRLATDKTMFRRTILESAYGFSESMFQAYIRNGASFIEVLNINNCYWFSSSTLVSFIPRCRNLRELHLIDCRATVKGLMRIIGAFRGLTSLAISVTNILEFTISMQKDRDVQASLETLLRFVLHVREEPPHNGPTSFSFHVSQQTTLFEYCPNLQSFAVIGQPGIIGNHMISKQLIQPIIAKKENMMKLREMSINSTNDATARMLFFGLLIVAFDIGVKFKSLSVSGLNLQSFTRKTDFIKVIHDSSPFLDYLDLSRVQLDDVDSSLSIENAQNMKYLNLADVRSSRFGFRRIAAECTNLTSLNLRGTVFSGGHRHWNKVELSSFDYLLQNCNHLQHLNLTGIHDHMTGCDPSLCGLLSAGRLKGLQTLALPVCCLVDEQSRRRDGSQTEETKVVFTGFGKRLRLAPQNVQPSTSSSCLSELDRLFDGCPTITQLEIINAGFVQSTVHMHQNPKKGMYDPCRESYNVADRDLMSIAKFRNLKYLQLTGLPAIRSCFPFQEIAKNCLHLRRLYLAYIGLSINHVLFDSLKHFHQLEDIRIEQHTLRIHYGFFSAIEGCKRLQRLCIISRNVALEPESVEDFVHRMPCLYVIQLFSDTPLKICEKLQSTLRKRYESQRPGFSAVIHPLQHDDLPLVIMDIQLKNLEEMTLLTSSVCSKPP